MSEEEGCIVREILRRHLPPGTRVFVFGSRAAGRVKPWSDLDLSIEANEPISFIALATLREAFDESDLRWKVDLVDRATVSEAFGKIIDAHKIALD